MSDELPAGSVSLEDDAPAAPAPVAPAEPAAPPVQAAEDHPAEVDAVEVAGQKYVPVSALIAERKGRQSAEQSAARVQQLEQQLAQSAPYVQFLQANPQLMQRQAQPEPVPAKADPTQDPEALDAAQLMDFYTPEGKPDTVRGAKFVAQVQRQAERIAAQTVQPYQQQSEESQSNANFQDALRVKDADGRSPSVESLTAVWASMPRSYTADRRVAGVLAATAIGFDRMGKKSAPAIALPPPALETEPSGGQPRVRQAMSPLEQNIAKERGMNATTWNERTKGFVAGRPNTMEE